MVEFDPVAKPVSYEHIDSIKIMRLQWQVLSVIKCLIQVVSNIPTHWNHSEQWGLGVAHSGVLHQT